MPKCDDCGCEGAANWGDGRTLCIGCKSSAKKVATELPPVEVIKRKRKKSRAKAEKKRPKRKTPRTCGICKTVEEMEPRYDLEGKRILQKVRVPWVDDRGEPFVFCTGTFEDDAGKKEHRCVPCQKAMEKPMINPLVLGRVPPPDATTWICGATNDQISETVCFSRQNGGGYKKRGGRFPKQCCTKKCPLFI